MSSEHDGGGFFARWSRRKAEQREGRDVAPEPASVEPDAEPARPTPGPDQRADLAPPPHRQGAAVEPPPPPPPTLADAEALAPGQEVSRFLAPNVDPGVKNAALRKLFADPHYNVMDGLDIYIDDYGKPDPIPPEMLRQMVQSKFLGLFADEEQAARADAEPPDRAAAQDIPAAPSPPGPDAHNSLPHEDADLRLQPDDAVGGSGAREGARPRKG